MSQSIPPNTAHQISLEDAIDLTSRYRDNRVSILDTEVDSDVLPLNETFNKEVVLSLLDDSHSEAMRIYFGMTEDLKIHAVLVAVDSDGNDLLPSETNPGYKILEDGFRCPVDCPPSSALNT